MSSGAGATYHAEAGTDYVISTVHRAKGRERKRVGIADDFRFRMVDGRMTLKEDEMRLLYVALKRGSMPWISPD
jgi:hypothetical protein